MIELQETSREIWEQKYQLFNANKQPLETNVDGSYVRVAKALASVELPKDQDHWYEKFLWALRLGATPAGRIMSNAGAEEHKPATSLINCTVSQIMKDSMHGVLDTNMQAGLTLKAGCGIGYEFSTLRPKGSFVNGAGAYTSGPLSFMDIFDKTCFTVSSAGGRRGAQMATFAIWHPDVEEFIKAKREDGRLRQFNLSLLMDDEFFEAVKSKSTYDLVFPVKPSEIEKGLLVGELIRKKRFWDTDYCKEMGYDINSDDEILCQVFKTVNAVDLWDTIMKSTYDFAEPGILLIDRINEYNNNWFCEEIRSTNPCAEQPLPPHGSCLLGSINLTSFVDKPFTDDALFNFELFKEATAVFTRMLDNVVEINGLPLEEQRHEILSKRRHGMGYLGLGSALTMMGLTYGSPESVEFTAKVSKELALENYRQGALLAKEKGACPLLSDKDNLEKWMDSKYLKQLYEVDPELKDMLAKHGCRFTHATSIAPTGTISLSLNNNASNGIEPSFAHKYTRNVIKEGKNSKKAVDVYSYEMLVYKEMFGEEEVPNHFSIASNITWKEHIDIQAAAQVWVDSSISKTINVPTEMSFEDFKQVYMYAYDKGLKGCTTFRFNPEAFQGVLVNESDLEATEYVFVLDSGEEITVKGNEKINYDGQEHTGANLYDAIKEGYYGKF